MRQAAVGTVLAVLATSNLFIPNLSDGFLTDPTTIALALTALTAARAWLGRRCYIGRPHILLVVAALTFVPGLINAADHDYGQSKAAGIAMAFVITTVAMEVLPDPRHREWFLRGLGVAGVFVAGALLLLGDTSGFGGRASVFGMNPIGLGRMAALTAMLAALTAIIEKRRRMLLLAVTAVAGYAAMGTGSRAPLLAAAIAMVLTLLVNRRPGSRTNRVLGVGALMGLGYLFVRWGGIDASSRLLTADSSGRDKLWRESWALIPDNPTGLGFGGLYGHITRTPAMRATGEVQYSHNVLLETAVEGGWLALLGLLVLLVVSFRRLRADSATPAGALMLAVWAFAFVNACASSDLVGNRLLWVMIGAGLAVELRPRLRRDKTEGHQRGVDARRSYSHPRWARNRRRPIEANLGRRA